VAERWPRRDQAQEALYGAGWCSLEMGDEPAMTKAFEELATRFPDHRRAPQGLLHVADHLYNQGRLDEAGRWYGAIDERYDEGRPVREAQKLLRVLADMEADSLYAEAMALFDAGEMEGAIAALGRVVKEHPGTPSEAAARCNIGVAYQRLLDYRRAAEAYWDAVQALETREGEREALEFARNSLEWIQVEVFQEDSEEGV